MKLRTMIKPLALSAVAVFSFSSSAYATDEAFDATISLIAPIVITETQALAFPDTTQGADSTVTVAAADATAAIFSATGTTDAAITASVVEASITMTTGAGVTTPEQITVDTWAFGGDLTDGGGSGTATLTGGSLSDLRVGASANVLTEDVAGAYTGTATFRIVYQ